MYTFFCIDLLSPNDITMHLHAATTTTGTPYGIHLANISTHSLHLSRAMVILCAELDSNKIWLLGHWQSDEMLWYLHIQAYPLISKFTMAMLQHGTFHFVPNPVAATLLA